MAATWRIRIVESPGLQLLRRKGESCIFAHWHGDELAILHLVPIYNIATMISTSKDGEIMNSIILKLGGVASRGSSTRGGASALRGLIRLIRSGHSGSIAVDGPKGPLHEVKPGIFELAKLTGKMIVPMGILAKSKYIFKKSWNQTYLPLPFAKVLIFFEEPYALEAVSESPQIESKDQRSAFLCSQLKVQLHAARQHAEKHFSFH